MSSHSAETCARLGCHDGRFLSRHHVCACGEEGKAADDVPVCPDCEHPLDLHGYSGCMDSDNPGERDKFGFCVCMKTLAELLPAAFATARAEGGSALAARMERLADKFGATPDWSMSHRNVAASLRATLAGEGQ